MHHKPDKDNPFLAINCPDLSVGRSTQGDRADTKDNPECTKHRRVKTTPVTKCVSDASEEPSIGTLYKDMKNVTQGRKEKKRNDGSALWECISVRETECAPSAEQSNTGTLLTSLAIEAYSPLLHTDMLVSHSS